MGERLLQARVKPWLDACFGPLIAGDWEERNHRFLEEALETVQAAGCSAGEAHQLVDYVFDRSAGELSQEVGGVMITLAALCLAHGLDMHAAGEAELARIWTKVEAIREKQATKPKYGPLPAHVSLHTGELRAALLEEVSGLPNPQRTLLTHNERELIGLCQRLGAALAGRP